MLKIKKVIIKRKDLHPNLKKPNNPKSDDDMDHFVHKFKIIIRNEKILQNLQHKNEERSFFFSYILLVRK